MARSRADRDKAEVREWAQKRGMPMRYDDGSRVVEIIAMRDGHPIFYTTQNDDAAISAAADQVRNIAPYNATGAGVSVGIWDGGSVMINHQEFGNRIASVDGASSHYHATHVGGTIGASGIVARAEGMAPNVEIRSYDWNAAEAEMISAASSFPGEAGKVLLSNHSYGILAGWFFAGFTNPWTHRTGYHWWGNLAIDVTDDYYDNLFPGQAMRASTLKGLIIHAADDLGRPGPDYQYGWGLMNTHTAAELLKKRSDGNLICMTEAQLTSNSTANAFTCFADDAASIRVTLCWTDPPGASTINHDSRTAVLVNDLDLTVTGPSGTHYPYKLSYSNPEANATNDSENNVDNVEQVFIAAPPVGNYTITVDFDDSLQDGEQHYSLLTSGVVSDQDGDGLPDYWETGFFLSTTGGLATADADGDGFDNLSEYIAGSNPMDPNSVFGFISQSVLPSTGHPPYIVEWNSMPGRVYNVYWTYHLLYVPVT